MTTFCYGILGTGNIAHQFAAGVFSATGGAKRSTITATASRSGDKARAFCEQYGIEHALGSYQGLIDLPDDVCDAVYNALPNNLHAAWTIKALEAGKHVLCEKPIAMDAAEAATMFDAARANNRTLVEAFMYRTHPQTLAILDAIRGGAIGQIKCVRTSFCYNARSTQGNTRFDRELGGGALMDIGCYCIDLAMLVAHTEAQRASGGASRATSGGVVESIQAVGRLTDQGVDVSASGVLMFAGSGAGGGVASTFDCAMDTQASNLAQVCGTQGYIDIPVPWKPPAVGARWEQRGMTPPRQDGRRGEAAGGPYVHEHTTDAGQALYALEADAFARVALDGEEPFVSEADSLERMRILDELRRQVGVRWE